MKTYKELIFNNIQWLLENDYRVELTENSIIVVETYKSESRDEYLEKEVFNSRGSIKYFNDKCLQITDEKFRKLKKRLSLIK